MRRRTFLRTGFTASIVVGLAGCASDTDNEPTDSVPTTQNPETTTDEQTDTTTEEEETTEDDEPEINRPNNYRWDMIPGRNDELRNRLSQYVEDSVGGVVQDHPAFEYSTESERDDHTVDFEALKMYRDSNFDIISQQPDVDTPMEEIVEAFVDDELYQDAKNDDFVRLAEDDPTSFDTESWQNADTVEESLDYGHGLILSLAYGDMDISYPQQAGIIREAYKRHHDFDVLAWEVPMRQGSFLAGMMYSPDDDKIRTFNKGGEAWSGSGESQAHAEIQDWRVIEDPNNEARGNPTSFHHPVLFHTDEWDRGGIDFEDAKDYAISMVFSIGTERYHEYNQGDGEAVGIVNDITMATGAAEQLTRTILDYNNLEDDEADFGDIRDLADFAVGKYIEDPSTRGIIDTVDPEEDVEAEYDEYFSGGFGFYEVDDEQTSSNDIVREVRNDQAGEYNNFGETFEELETV